MIKLFRKIRKKMLSESKLGNYFVYAIGEIILVVIGILIALQINTVNQDRKRIKLEKVLLKQVKQEILNIYEDIWRDKARLELGENSHYNILKFIDQDAPYVDSLCFDFYWIKLDEYVYPQDASYSKVKEQGLDIISNDSIRIRLRELYEGHFPRLKKNNSFNPDISSVFNDYYLDNFKPNVDYTLNFSVHLINDTISSKIYANEHFTYPQKDNRSGEEITIGYVPLNFENLKNDTKFLMLLEQTKRYRNIKLRRYLYADFVIKDLVKKIDSELE